MKNQICSSRSLFRPPRPIARLADPNLNENSPRNGSNSSKSLRNATKQRAQRLQTIHIVAQSIPLTPASRLLDTLIVAHFHPLTLRNPNRKSTTQCVINKDRVRNNRALNGAGGGIRTHAMPGWKPGAFPLGDARSRMVQGAGVEPTTSRLSIARSAS